jgi:predicted metal-dependent HD superfamily phosphohydrolase
LARAELAVGHYSEAEVHCQRALAILEGSPRDYQALIDALSIYAWLLEKTARQGQAELIHTRVMVYRAKLQENEGKQ